VSWLQSNRTPLIVSSIALLVLLAGIWGVRTSDGSVKAREREARLAEAREGGQGAGADATPTLVVEVSIAQRAPEPELAELAGTLEPIRSTMVAAELAARVVEVPATEHAPIAEGGLLVRLDDALPQAELVRASAAHELARSELERQRRLGSRSVASEAELDRAAAEERRTFAALLEARTRVGHTRITAPFDGLVNALDLDPGAYVQPGTPIAEVLDVSTIELTVALGDRQVRAIEPGTTVGVRVDALGNEIVEGRVARVGRATRSGTGRYPVVVELDNAEGRLLPGMLAHVRFELGRTPAIRIPSRAILREFELDYVFVLDAEDRAHRVRITTRPVPFRPDRMEVVDGLAEGDRVVTSAVLQLRDGLRVRTR